MTNPFENTETPYVVLVNDENQHSLWPAAITVPAGWRAVHGPDTRSACIEHVEANWTDLRPASLVASMKESV
ncbi:MbtH family protein [Lentzea tibetensis]|uniref:MbtH family protein n=1 Tax=Lentzea tibetensis TaxID=2591470 RepID=A0A563EJN8_9PSEU|nr:MbtH family protein [Lentzea tibetensis]TWP46721.1 MbtH family protein [Lentzea tibetensis]